VVLSGMPVAGGLVGVAAECSWPRPTRPDDVLQVESEILEITPSRSRPDRGTVKIRSETRNQAGEVVMVLVSTLVGPRRPPRSPTAPG
jgi:acyl dehydratase